MEISEGTADIHMRGGSQAREAVTSGLMIPIGWTTKLHGERSGILILIIAYAYRTIVFTTACPLDHTQSIIS
jgi:hypothetical protein